MYVLKGSIRERDAHDGNGGQKKGRKMKKEMKS